MNNTAKVNIKNLFLIFTLTLTLSTNAFSCECQDTIESAFEDMEEAVVDDVLDTIPDPIDDLTDAKEKQNENATSLNKKLTELTNSERRDNKILADLVTDLKFKIQNLQNQ